MTDTIALTIPHGPEIQILVLFALQTAVSVLSVEFPQTKIIQKDVNVSEIRPIPNISFSEFHKAQVLSTKL